MSSDTIVIKITGNQNGYVDTVAIAYVFYDYKQNLFGIRIANIHDYNDDEVKYDKELSSYTSNKLVVCNFVTDVIPSIKSIDLLNYKHLPKSSDNITFERLFQHNLYDTIVSYPNTMVNYPTTLMKNKNKNKLKRCLNFINLMYNTY
jgi:hypothetical protein